MDGDGASPMRLTTDEAGEFEVSVSPDRRALAFVRAYTGGGFYPGTSCTIYSVGVTGFGLTALSDLGARDRNPAWSPDDTRIAICSGRDGDAEIFSIRADGADLIQLTESGTPDWSPTWAGR